MAAVPPICVLMPVYNGQKYLRSAIQSVLDQTFTDFELLVVDDGSSDRSADIVRNMAQQDTRVKLHQQENTGICGALNAGIAQTQSPWIARMDADDLCRPERLALQWAYVQDHPECVVLGGQVQLIDPEDWPINAKGPEPLDHDGIDRELLTGKWPLVHPALLLQRDAVLEVGGYRDELFPAEDHDLFLRLGEVGVLANLSETILDYRLHPKSISHSSLARQLQKIHRALEEAHQRRGLTEGLQPPPSEEPYSDNGLVHARWARNALQAGHPKTARKHARLAALKSPMNQAYWSLLARAWFNPQPQPTGGH